MNVLKKAAGKALSASNLAVKSARANVKFKITGPKVSFIKDHIAAKLPVYSTGGAAGADLHAVFYDGLKSVTIEPLDRKLIATGLRIRVEEGFEAQVRPRSGLALKSGVTVLNTPGTIDEDYRGPVGVILMNLGEDAVTINEGDRIAQMVVAPAVRAAFDFVEEFDETERGEGGFGSTGVKG